MSGTSRTETAIARWLEALANLTVPGSDPVSAERIAVMAGFLAMDLPAEAFSQRSLHAAAQGHRFFPAYDDVRMAVTTWWEANRPPAGPQLGGPVIPGMTATDRSWVAFYHKRRAEIWAQDSLSQSQAEAALAVVSSLVRAQSARAWEAITGRTAAVAAGSTEAAVAYVAKLLRPEPQPGQPRYEVVEAPAPFRDVTAKGDDLLRLRGLAPPKAAVVTDRGEWA